MLLTLPNSTDAESTLRLLHERRTVINELIDRLCEYQSSQDVVALSLAIEPPVLCEPATAPELWQTPER